jgi:hypothetical protein
VSYVSHMFYHDFDASNVLRRNKFGRVVALYVGVGAHKTLISCANISSECIK